MWRASYDINVAYSVGSAENDMKKNYYKRWKNGQYEAWNFPPTILFVAYLVITIVDNIFWD
jgi:hypothetical protein